MEVHSFHPSALEAEADRSLHVAPAWTTELVSGKPGLPRDPVSGKNSKSDLITPFPENTEQH